MSRYLRCKETGQVFATTPQLAARSDEFEMIPEADNAEALAENERNAWNTVVQPLATDGDEDVTEPEAEAETETETEPEAEAVIDAEATGDAEVMPAEEDDVSSN